MNAKKCDRCGMFYVTTDDCRVYAIYKRGVPFSTQLDLCPKCYNDLLTFRAKPGVVTVHFKCKEEKESDVE